MQLAKANSAKRRKSKEENGTRPARNSKITTPASHLAVQAVGYRAKAAEVTELKEQARRVREPNRPRAITSSTWYRFV